MDDPVVLRGRGPLPPLVVTVRATPRRRTTSRANPPRQTIDKNPDVSVCLISLAFSFRPATIGLFPSFVGYVTRLVHVSMTILGFVTMMMERLMKSLTNTNLGIVDLHCAHWSKLRQSWSPTAPDRISVSASVSVLINRFGHSKPQLHWTVACRVREQK